MADIADLTRYASENAAQVRRLNEDGPDLVPVAAIALANVVEQLVAALVSDDRWLEGYKQGREEALYEVSELVTNHMDGFYVVLRKAAQAEVRLDGDEVVIGEVVSP